MQFSRRIRLRHPAFHRWAGRVDLAGAAVAAVSATDLALTFDEVGRRPPLLIFSLLWLGFALAAWSCARRRRIAAHVRFVVRTYAVALALVLVRVLGDAQEHLLPFITDVAVRDVTREWACFVLPLVLVEAWMVWIPDARAARSPNRG